MTAGIRKITPPRIIITILLFLVLISSLFLRTRRILDSPGWFRDEGLYLEVAQQIGKAKLQMGAVNITFVGTNMTHPPFYFICANLFFKLARPDMYFFRLFNALLGVLACFTLFLLGVEAGRFGKRNEPAPLSSEILGLLAAFFFSFHYDAVLYNRMGMPYNLYMLEAILVAFFILRYLRLRLFPWCLGACVVASISLLTVYYSVVFIPFILLAILYMKKLKHLWALACVPIPLLIFFAYLALGKTPGFRDDFLALKNASRSGSLFVILLHYQDFFQTGVSYFIGLAGLLFLRRKNAAGFLFLLYLFIIHIVLRKEDTIIRFIHYPVIPILPFVALGVAAIVLWAWNGVRRFSPAFLLLIPAILGAWFGFRQTKEGVYGRFNSPMEFGMTKNTEDNFKAAAFINRNTKHSDLVISTSVLWSLLRTLNADLAQSVVFKGEKIFFYKQDYPRERFLFSPEIDRAKFIVMDAFTNEWRNQQPDSSWYPITKEIREIEANWKLVHTQGEFRIYLNPDWQDKNLVE
ncbi:hypothetical protein JW926_00380 [Candidatus Sumerlaeota bacterium]|nr:hypothetical protein [Candidatus Sumerlaeota bacterium]